ncbi:MAG: CBS domain-containing protein [Desulfobacterales bacterium]
MTKKATQPPEKDLTVITTHTNADFDAMASMLAAQKLYPGAIVVFPGSQEVSLRNFFIESMIYLYNMAEMKDIDFLRIRQLVIVDTKQASRIGKFATLLTEPDLTIHIYDHHPAGDNDIKGHYELQQPTGANVTLLTEIIMERNIDLSADEATIMSLGIYEDTGSLTFPSTTGRDYMAAAYLLSKGANLNTIANLMDREISPDQVRLLNDMVESVTHYNINGVDVVLTTVTRDSYVPDFAFLVHKMIKMENANAVFSVARMVDKIYIVARSKIAEVDVGAILTELGGGGHAFAAAVTLREKTLAQAEQELFDVLYRQIGSRRQARDLMSAPPITVDAHVSCRKAAAMLTRYNINALLVTEKADGGERPLGCITRQIIEKALYHKLGHVPVIDYTNTELSSIRPDSELLEIQNKIIETKQRLLPVMDNDTIVGVVTRTDLLNVLIRQSQHQKNGEIDPFKKPIHPRTRNITKFIDERLSKRLIGILKSIGTVANDLGRNAYVVGGFVRDLFLYRPNEDLDIVIEGDGIAFAKTFRKMVGARIHTYEKFGTAVIIFPDGFKIDVASARMEYYKFPAALPTVEMSSIKLDLYRRDFTINTLAIQLNPGKFGWAIDFFSAQNDIKAKSIRVLHNLSFVEDPTRVFRAIRFEQRFGFTIGKLTSGLIGNAVKMDFFKRLSGRRVFSELRQILQEESPIPALVRLDEYDLLGVVHPSIDLNPALIGRLNGVRKVLSWHDLLFLDESYMKWAVYFLALISHCNRKTSEEICERLELPPRLTRLFIRERFDGERCLFWLEHHLPVKNSILYNRLSEFKIELILFMMATTKQEEVKRLISYYYTHLKHVTTSLKGKDLLEIGIPPSPVYREILQAICDARLDGQLNSESDERDFVKTYVQ